MLAKNVIEEGYVSILDAPFAPSKGNPSPFSSVGEGVVSSGSVGMFKSKDWRWKVAKGGGVM